MAVDTSPWPFSVLPGIGSLFQLQTPEGMPNSSLKASSLLILSADNPTRFYGKGKAQGQTRMGHGAEFAGQFG
jgi:hypothetical protein